MSKNPPQSGAAHAALPSDCKTETLGVAFFDLSRMAEWASTEQDAVVASFFQEFYALAAEHIEGAGGRIVKFMGDAGLTVFPEDRAEDVIFALAEFARASREAAQGYGLDTYLNVNVHVGPVLTGSFGPPGAERYDVIGKTVNIAARLGRRGITLSAQAFRCLSAEGRKRFDKLMQPITYRLRR
jgi:class 3 adenylate cyclase